jgi:ABC-type transporter Mla MlaB component
LAAPEQSRTAQVRALRLTAEPSTIVLVISGRITRADVPRLCERVHHFLEESDARVVICDVSAVVEPDAVAVDALARLQLAARRLGYQIKLRHTCEALQDLLTFTGLRDVVPTSES